MLLLFSTKAEEREAPLVGQQSCWDLDPIIKELRYPLAGFLTFQLETSLLSRSDPFRVLFALERFMEGAGTLHVSSEMIHNSRTLVYLDKCDFWLFDSEKNTTQCSL